MARIIYGAIVESIRGSIGGTTFQSNAHGYSVKSKPNIIHPRTPLQNKQKQLLARATQAWGELSDAQRADWVTWASTNPQYAKHNASSELSGYSVFCRTAVYLLMSSLSLITNPSYSLAPADTIVFTLTNDSGDLDLSVTSVTDDDKWQLILFFSRPFKSSQNFIGTSPVFVTTYLNRTDTVDITSLYSAKFGVVPAIGDRVAMSVQWFDSKNGSIKARQEEILTILAP